MPETRNVLYVGSPVGMQAWLSENRHANSPEWRIYLALNGEEHLRGVRGPIKIVHQRGWVPPEDAQFVDAAITAANRINGQLLGEEARP